MSKTIFQNRQRLTPGLPNPCARKGLGFFLIAALILSLLHIHPGVAAGAQALRHFGDDRVATAIAISRAHWSQSPDAVVVSADTFADGLTAGLLAAHYDAPLLLTRGPQPPAGLIAELERLAVERVWIVGGPAAVPTQAEDGLGAGGRRIFRVAGRDRFETAATVARAARVEPGVDALIALGTHEFPDRAWPDALSAGAFNVLPTRSPVLLTAPDLLPDATRGALAELTPGRALIVGGPAAVGEAVERELQGDLPTRRMAGASRYETSQTVVDAVLARTSSAPVPLIAVSGANFPDSLAGAALAARTGGILLLVPPGDMNDVPSLRPWLTDLRDRFSHVVVLGGPSAVSQLVAEQLEEVVGTRADSSDGPTAPTTVPPAPSTTTSPTSPPTAPGPATTTTVFQGGGGGGGGGGNGGTTAPPTTSAPTTTPPTTAAPTPPTTAAPAEPADDYGLASLSGPPVDPTVATSVAASTAFLYTGDNPVQRGVTAGAIDPRRAAVVFGRVLDRDGAPLPGVRVAVHDQPQIGSTLTRADGAFDLALNGGGPLTIDYSKSGFLPSQRTVSPGWNSYAEVEDVVLVALDPNGTNVDLSGASSALQVAAGSVVTDDDGTRQAVVLVPAGTSAELVMPDGSRRPVTTATMRITEYTVGANGPQAMPGELPAASGYTYASEFSLDEAMDTGATEVRFSSPVVAYLDDFLGFPTGTVVPTGYYDRTAAEWVGSRDGVVLTIVAESEGMAAIDADGDGAADSPETLALLGITDAERSELARRYDVGKKLWRTMLPHLTPYDMNWGWWVPDPPLPTPAPNPPPARDPRGDRPDGDCERPGSIIGCQNQSLGESIAVPGTGSALVYNSARSPSPLAIDIPLTGSTVPPNLLRINYRVSVNGRVVRGLQRRDDVTDGVVERGSITPNLVRTVGWDGRDRYGGTVVGTARAHVIIYYTYEAVRPYRARPFFGGSGSGVAIDDWSGFGRLGTERVRRVTDSADLQGPNGRRPTTTRQEYSFDVTVRPYPHAQAVGGWSLDTHHVYDPAGRVLHLGTGDRVDATSPLAPMVLEHVAGKKRGATADGLPAAESSLGDQPVGMAPAPDGSIYFVQANRVRRIDAEGILTTVAGTGTRGFSGDGGPATAAQLAEPRDVAVAADGTLYVADTFNDRIRRIGPDGLIATVAGGATGDPEADGRATAIELDQPSRLAVAGDGSLLFTQTAGLRRLGTDGWVTTIRGRDANGVGPGIYDVATRGNRIVYVRPGELIEVSPAGEHTVLRTFGHQTDVFIDIEADGDVLIVRDAQVRRFRVDGGEELVAGAAGDPFADCPREAVSGTPATRAPLCRPRSVAAAPDGSVLIGTSAQWDSDGAAEIVPARISRSTASLPAFLGDGVLVGSPDGLEAYLFDPEGRHLRTLDAITGGTLRTFEYSGGRLTGVVDAFGRRTTIERDASGDPTRVVAPGGEITTLSVGADGNLATITDPAGSTTALGYGRPGLLTNLVDPAGGRHVFEYDSAGLLVRDTGPSGAVTSLARTTTETDISVAVTDPDGLVTTHRTARQPGGVVERTVTGPSGGVRRQVDRPDGTTTVTDLDGTTLDLTRAPDARWGMTAAYLSNAVTRRPGGATATRSESRSLTLADPANPLSVSRLFVRSNRDGAIQTTIFTGAASGGSLVTTSPEGRVTTTAVNEAGQVTSHAAPGLDPVTSTYDALGRLTERAFGTQRTTLTYEGDSDRVLSTTDALGRKTTFTYDALGNVTSTLAAGAADPTAYAWSEAGLESLTLPGGAVHDLVYDPARELSSYVAPGAASYDFSNGPGGRRTGTAMPSGAGTAIAYDAAGRMSEVSQTDAGGVAVASSAFTHAGTTDAISSAERRGPTRVAEQRLDFTYDGRLPTAMTMTGVAPGGVTVSYDARSLPTSIAIAGGPTLPVAHDRDGLRTGFGPFNLTRGTSGDVTAIGDGIGALTLSYDSMGRPTRRAKTVGGVAVSDDVMTRDAANRLTARTLTLGGTATELAYRYDSAGRLTEVLAGGATVEAYTWDDDGNRLTSRDPASGATRSSTYDAAGRVTSAGGVAYTWHVDGTLAGRGSETFNFSPRGELLAATLAGGDQVSYAYDAFGRRVARTDGQGTTEYLYGNPHDVLQVTASRAPGGELSVYHYDEEQRLVGLARGGSQYYVVTDQLGSPLLVTDAAGATVKQFAYDGFGNVLSETNPAFDLPIGFAGGLADRAARLVRFGARDYDPASGQWTAPDPALFGGGQANLYVYASGDPVNRVDRAGLASFEVGAGLGLYLGLKLGITSEGFSFCWEGGVGIGAGISVDPLEGLDQHGSSTVQMEIAGDVAGMGMSAKMSRQITDGPCGEINHAKYEAKACLGPACAKVNNDGPGLGVDLAEVADLELQAKATANYCMASQW